MTTGTTDGSTGAMAMASQEAAFTLKRVVDAPIDLVWKAHTEAEHLKAWFGPRGWKPDVAKVDLRPGGMFHYRLRGPDGATMWGKWVFQEISEPQRLVTVVSFSDESGGLTVHPWEPNWPRETLSTVSFSEQAGKTLVEVRWELLQASQAERQTFAAGHDAMRQGWTGTFEQLDQYLAEVQGKAPCPETACMAQPQAEHEWLHRFVGEWEYEHSSPAGPDGQEHHFTGTERVRTLGGLWIVGEGEGDMPGGGKAKMMLTLGYDPAKGRYVGTWVGSMMTHLWVYEGQVDAAGNELPLHCQGPSFDGSGKLMPYKDVHTFIDDNHRTLTSYVQNEDGSWQIIMKGHYRRKA